MNRVVNKIIIRQLWDVLYQVVQPMIHHQDLTSAGFAGRRQLTVMLLQGCILFAGNRRLKIYGTLICCSGKRMNTVNRVFFADEQEALDSGYRPCAHCLRKKYRLWRVN